MVNILKHEPATDMGFVKLTYQRRFVVVLLIFSLVILAVLFFFQYNRETGYKTRLLDEYLQGYNRALLDAIDRDETPYDFIASHREIDGEGLRVSVIDIEGRMLFDNTLDTLSTISHLSRPEIEQAIASGKGCAERRQSSSTGKVYFYSATMRDSIIVRTAAPYGMSISEVLRPDVGFIWLLIAVAGIIGLLAWLILYFLADRDRQSTERMRVKRQLTNNINHELKTPIAAIQLCIDTLKTRTDLSDSQRTEIIDKCYLNSRRLASLMTDVATLARLDDGRDNIEKQCINLRTLVKEVVAEFPPTEQSLPVGGRIADSLDVWGNQSLLSSVFRNLIANSNSYSHGTAIAIEAYKTEDGMIEVIFSDNGVGVPQEHLHRIFERFYRIDKGRSRAMGGTGLGLAIVRNAVLAHGGEIKATNLTGGGLCFTFTLEAVPASH